MRRNLSTSILLIALVAMFSGCGPGSYFGVPMSKSSLDSLLDSRMAEASIPGLAFALIEDGEIAYHNVNGMADVEGDVPVAEDTIFEAASMSKSVFAHFVMTFVEAGEIDLDKPLYEYLEHPAIAYDDRYKSITARMALSHRSGFPNWRWDRDDEKLTIEFDPGTDYLYSGEGYQYVAEVLRHIKGTDWQGLDELFQERIAKPAGMTHTRFIPDEYAWDHKAQPYDENAELVDWKNHDDHIRNEGVFVAAASIHSEARDFARWMIYIMDGGGLTQDSLDELFKVHSFVDVFGGFNVNYTLGFFHPDVPGTNLFMHGGNNYGFTCGFAFDPDKDWGYVVFTNSEYGEELSQTILYDLAIGPNWRTYIALLVIAVVVGLVVAVVGIRRRLRGRVA